MPENDPGTAVTGGSRGIDIGHLAYGKRRSAHDSCHLWNDWDRDCDNQFEIDAEHMRPTEHGNHNDGEHNDRESQQDVDKSLYEKVEASAEIGRDDADRAPCGAAEKRGQHADGDGRAGSVEDAAENITAEI